MSDSTTDAGERIQLRTGLLPLRLFLLQNYMRSRSSNPYPTGFSRKGLIMNNQNSVAMDYERGARIADKRKELGMTQDELAYQIVIDRQALYAIENFGAIKTNTLDKLVEVLGVSETFIMRGEIDDIKDGLLREAAEVMADMDELQIRQFIAMMKAAKRII